MTPLAKTVKPEARKGFHRASAATAARASTPDAHGPASPFLRLNARAGPSPAVETPSPPITIIEAAASVTLGTIASFSPTQSKRPLTLLTAKQSVQGYGGADGAGDATVGA